MLRPEAPAISSRRSLPSKVPDHTVTCGWDNPLQTYFCTVVRDRVAGEREADDPVVLWLGLDEREVRTAEALVAPLAPYAELDAAMLSMLCADRAADIDRGPTVLQRQSLAAISRRRT